MRFFSSSALASAEKLRLAANCSAAETMVLAPERPTYSSYRALSAGLFTENGNSARASQDRPQGPHPSLPASGEEFRFTLLRKRGRVFRFTLPRLPGRVGRGLAAP